MGEIKENEKGLIFAGIMLTSSISLNEIIEEFKDFGHILGLYGPINFSNISKYYDKEMGENVQKYYAFFDKIIDSSELADWKILSNKIEEKLSKEGKRTVNFDVGYIGLSKFVLASTKNFYHRICLGKGIYAELTLYYRKKGFHSLPWTYKDYQKEEVQKLLKKGREYLRDKLNEEIS